MTQKYKYNTPVGGYIGVTATTTPGAISSQTEITRLYDNGVLHNAFGDVSGYMYVNFATNPFVGDSLTDEDELLMDGGSNHTMLIWDERVVGRTNDLVDFNLYGANPNGTSHTFPSSDADGRYGLPGGGNNQMAAIDIIRVGIGASHNNDQNLVNLSYNTESGGIAYNTKVTFIGGPGRDLFIGGENNDIAYGGDEHTGLGDGIWGGGGNDTIFGGANLGTASIPGADDLYGYSGDDVIYGANDGDVYYGDNGNDVIYGAGFSGVGTIGSGFNGDSATFFGGDGNDTLYASANVNGGSVTSTKEYFFGGVPYFDPAATQTGPGGVQVVTGAGWKDHNFVQISRASGLDTGLMDVVSYTNSPTAITVNLGAAATYNASNTTTYDVTVGGNVYTVNDAAIPIGTPIGTGAGGAVNDIFFGIEGLIGSQFADVLTGSSADNYLDGQGGDDKLFGGIGIDTLFGGLGNDTADGGIGDDSINGNGGDDTVFGGDGRDTIYGGTGLDTIFGDDGNDFLFGRADLAAGGTASTTGWDGSSGTSAVSTITQYLNQDSVFGGVGTDTFDMIDVNLGAAGAAYFAFSGANGTGATQKMSGVEIILGGAGNDILNLTNGSNLAVSDNVSIFIGDGNDVVFSGSGSDLIVGDSTSGGSGTDTLYGGGGNDTIFAGLLNDSLDTTAGDFLYGGAGLDLIYGSQGVDTLSGGTGGQDTLYGAGSSDIFLARSDVAPGGSTTGWDGVVGSAGVAVAIGAQGQSLDKIFGGFGIDTLNLDDTANNGGLGAYYNAYGGGTLLLTSVEIITATALADIINLTDGSTQSYGTAVSIFAGDGNDFVFSGAGGDLIVGDATTGGVGSDTLFGGAGNDTIFGDLFNPALLFGGNDSLNGGEGNDTVFGGLGNDHIGDSDTGVRIADTSIDGGAGSDEIDAFFRTGGATAFINGGSNLGGSGDGADFVKTTGVYLNVTSNLGLGNDAFIGSGSAGSNIDTVFGEDGNDALSAWTGTDVLFGGLGNDIAWGGAGSDTIFGGAATDSIYPGGGGNNVMYGGGGEDYYYISRDDGAGNQLFDQVRAVDNTDRPDGTTNYIIVFGEFNISGTDTTVPGQGGIDFLQNGLGVHETDHDILNNSGMVQVVDNGSHLWTLSIISGQGAGTNVQFDDRDIRGIGLWNNDAGVGQEVIESYMWYDAGQGGHVTAGYYYLAPGTPYP